MDFHKTKFLLIHVCSTGMEHAFLRANHLDPYIQRFARGIILILTMAIRRPAYQLHHPPLDSFRWTAVHYGSFQPTLASSLTDGLLHNHPPVAGCSESVSGRYSIIPLIEASVLPKRIRVNLYIFKDYAYNICINDITKISFVRWQTMDALLIILLVFIFYFFICLFIAGVRFLFSTKGKRTKNFRATFWSFFLEILNPMNWL